MPAGAGSSEGIRFVEFEKSRVMMSYYVKCLYNGCLLSMKIVAAQVKWDLEKFRVFVYLGKFAKPRSYPLNSLHRMGRSLYLGMYCKGLQISIRSRAKLSGVNGETERKDHQRADRHRAQTMAALANLTASCCFMDNLGLTQQC